MSLVNRLKKNFKHKKKWAKREEVSAWRLYDRDIPEYPFIVDLYYSQDSGPFAIIWKRFQKIDHEKGHAALIPEIKDCLQELGFPPENIVLKERTPQGTLTTDGRYQKLDSSQRQLLIKEGQLKFLVNPYDYLDTGLFLDHRPLRQRLSQMDLKGRKALNLFCYTGSLSVALANAGAEVVSVDLNPNYLKWARENFKANDLNPDHHEFVEADCLSFLKEEEPFQYDIIVIDPPSFSVSKKFRGNFDIARDHPFVLKAVHGLLVEGGEAFFSTNLRKFKLAEDLQKDLGPIKSLSHWTIPEDYHDKKIHQSFHWVKESV